MGTNINSKQLTPAYAIHPGEMLADELKVRAIKQKDFATLIGMAPTQLNEIIKGKRAITADVALLIEKALNMDAVLWMNLQTNYELNVAKQQEKNKSRLEALDMWQMIKDMIPYNFLKKQGIIHGNPTEDIPRIKDVYGIVNIEQLPQKFSQLSLSHFRKSDKLTVDKINLTGWTYLTHFKAEKLKVAAFDSRKQQELIVKLNQLFLRNKNTLSETEKLLALYGIKLIVLEHPDKCAVDGISFWSNGNPAIGLSLRHERLDYFAFTLFHELGHVYLHLTSDNEAQFIDMEHLENNPKEIEANEFASEQLINPDIWDEFCFRYKQPVDSEFIEFAIDNKLHPAILLGRYCHTKKKYNLRSTINRKLN